MIRFRRMVSRLMPTMHRDRRAFEAGTGAKGHQRHPVAAGDTDDLRHLLGRLGLDHHVGQADGMMALVDAVMAAHRLAVARPRAEPRLELGDGSRDIRLQAKGAVHSAAARKPAPARQAARRRTASSSVSRRLAKQKRTWLRTSRLP